MILHDFILFGRTVPEKSKKYGRKVCMAGYSQELRDMVRIYPLPIDYKLSARSISEVHLERNHLDSRAESWVVKDRNPFLYIKPQKNTVASAELEDLLERAATQSIDQLNDQRKSLGIIKGKNIKTELRSRSSVKNPKQLELFDQFKESGGFKTATDYFLAPYLRFNDTTEHCLQLREWGLYELMRKYETEGRQITTQNISDSLFLAESRNVFLVVGNMAHCRNSWLIIKTFSFKRQKQMSLFSNKIEITA